MKHPRPRSALPATAAHRSAAVGAAPRAPADAPAADDDDDDDPSLSHSPSTEVRQLRAKASTALVTHRQRQEAQVNAVNQELDALAAMDLRAITRHALRDGISQRPGSGQPSQTAVSQGAMLIAQALHRDGVQASGLLPLLGLWQRRVDATDLYAAAEQLLGQGLCRLDYPRGTPLADFCEVLFGKAQEVGDLYAAGGVVNSVHRKLELLESRGSRSVVDRPRKPFVRKYTTGGGAGPGPRSRPG